MASPTPQWNSAAKGENGPWVHPLCTCSIEGTSLSLLTEDHLVGGGAVSTKDSQGGVVIRADFTPSSLNILIHNPWDTGLPHLSH